MDLERIENQNLFAQNSYSDIERSIELLGFDFSKPGSDKSIHHISISDKAETDIKIEEMLLYLKQFERVKIKIHGYTSIEGNSNDNQVLSTNRALKLKEYLIHADRGVNQLAANRIIETIGYGSLGAQNTENEITRKQDRRIKITYVEVGYYQKICCISFYNFEL